VISQQSVLTPAPSASRTHITSTLTPHITVDTYENFSRTLIPEPKVTLAPCCYIETPLGVGLNFWYPQPVTVIVAKVTSVQVATLYKNWPLLTLPDFISTTIPRSSSPPLQFITQTRPSCMELTNSSNLGQPYQAFQLHYSAGPEGEQTMELLFSETSVHFHGLSSRLRCESYLSRWRICTTKHSSQSPTPFYSFGGFALWTGYQQGTACNQLSVRGSLTYTSSQNTNDVSPYLYLTAKPAIAFEGNLSEWLDPVNIDYFEGQADIPMHFDLAQSLVQYPAYSTQYSILGSCGFVSTGIGAPSILIPATEITVPVSTTTTIADNFVPPTPAEGGASLSAIASDGNNRGQILSTPNLGSIIAGVLDVTKAQPTSTASAFPETAGSSASINQESHGNRVISNSPFTSAYTLNVKTTLTANDAPPPAAATEQSESSTYAVIGFDSTGVVSSTHLQGATTAAADRVGGSQQPQGTTGAVDGSTLLALSVASSPSFGYVSKPTLTVANAYQSTLVTATIHGAITNYATQNPVSKLLEVISIPSSELGGVDLQLPQPWPVTDTFDKLGTTEWADPVSQAAPQVQATAVIVSSVQIAPVSQQGATILFNPVATSTLLGQVSAFQQPKATLTVIEGTILSFLASSPPSSGSGEEQTQTAPKPIPITALVSGSIVTSWAVPLSSASSGDLSSAEDQTHQQSQAQPFATTISNTVMTAWSIPVPSEISDFGSLSIEGQSQVTPQPSAALISAIESIMHMSQASTWNTDQDSPITALKDNSTGLSSVSTLTASNFDSSVGTDSSGASISTRIHGNSLVLSSTSAQSGAPIQVSSAAQSSHRSNSGATGLYRKVPWMGVFAVCCFFGYGIRAL